MQIIFVLLLCLIVVCRSHEIYGSMDISVKILLHIFMPGPRILYALLINFSELQLYINFVALVQYMHIYHAMPLP